MWKTLKEIRLSRFTLDQKKRFKEASINVTLVEGDLKVLFSIATPRPLANTLLITPMTRLKLTEIISLNFSGKEFEEK